MNQDLDKLAKEIFLLAPDCNEDIWDELPMDDEIKQVVYKFARHIAIMVLEAKQIALKDVLDDLEPYFEATTLYRKVDGKLRYDIEGLQRQKNELEKI